MRKMTERLDGLVIWARGALESKFVGMKIAGLVVGACVWMVSAGLSLRMIVQSVGRKN